MVKNAKPKRRLLIAKNLIMMLAMAVCIVLAVSAWFTQKSTAEASGISVATKQGGLDIAPCIKTYNADGTVKTDGPGVFDTGITFNVPADYGTFVKDCTGDGMDLIVPEFNVTKDYESVRKYSGKEVNENLTPVDALSNLDADYYVRQGENPPEYQYLEFEFYVRSAEKELFATSQSRVVAETEIGGQSLSTVPSGKKSEYGNFNVDGLVGAIRVSLIGEGCTTLNQTWSNGSLVTTGNSAPDSARSAKENQLFWLARPDVHLNIAPQEGDITNWTLSTGLNVGDSYEGSYYKEPDQGTGVTLVEEDENLVVSSGTATESGVTVKSLGQSVNITDFSYSDDLQPVSVVVNGSNPSVRAPYYVTKFTLRVWIEGTDAEARRAMDGGKFSLKLFFE